MSAKASILVDSREDVFAIPYDAIQTNEAGESVIYVVDTSKRATEGSESTEEFQEGERARTTRDGKKTDMPGNGEKPQMPEDGQMPDMSDRNNGSSGTGMNRKAIVVEVGLESDYYTEISSDELEEGMLVITGTTTGTSSSDSSDNENAMSDMFGGMSGSGRNGNSGMSGGGAPGGGPGGR